MSHSTTLERQVEHARWANLLLLDALQRAGLEPPEAWRLFRHVAAAENVWLCRIAGRPQEVAVWPELSVGECRELVEASSGELRELARDASPEALARVVDYRNSAGVELRSSVEDILTHVFLHGQYHRGQVNLLLRRHGAEPAPVDYIGFVRGVPAATENRENQ